MNFRRQTGAGSFFFRQRGPALMIGAATLAALLSVLFHGCKKEPGRPSSPAIAVTTSWLECAARDVAGPHLRIVRLIPPGGCPGHFDVSPADVARMADCSILLRFDFQAGLEAGLRRLRKDEIRIAAVPAPGGLSIPENYAAACRHIAEILVNERLATHQAVFERLGEVESRMASLGGDCRHKAAQWGLRGRRAVCSNHQAAFCRWLGIDVAATYDSGGQADIGEIKTILDIAAEKPIDLIVANLQQGRQFADALAQRLGAKVVVLSNFPAMTPQEPAFDDMVRNNLDALISNLDPR